MTKAVWWIKDPDATLDYAIDWATEWLGDDTLATAEWTVPDGITKVSAVIDGGKARIWLSGGTAGVEYTLTCRVTTTGGRTDDRSPLVWVGER